MRVPVLHWLETVEADPGDWSQLVLVVSLGLLRLNPTQVGCLRCTGRFAWVIYVSPRHGAKVTWAGYWVRLYAHW